MEKITTVGIDLAKSVFPLHGVDGAGHCEEQSSVSSANLTSVSGG